MTERERWENLRDDACAAVSEVCKDGRWRMTIPVDERRDHDVRITRALRVAGQRIADLEAMHDAQRDRIQELTKALAQQLDANTRILEEREELRSENHRLMTCIKQTMRDRNEGDDD